MVAAKGYRVSGSYGSSIFSFCYTERSQRKKHDIAYMQNQKRTGTNELLYKTETDLENKPGEWGRGKGIESLELRCTYCYTRTYCLRPGTLFNIV